MRRIWKTLAAALVLSPLALGGGFSEARAQSKEAVDAALIMSGIGSMGRNLGIGAGAARFGTNGTPLIVGGNYQPNYVGGGGGYPGFARPPYYQNVSFQPAPYYPQPQPYYPQPQPYYAQPQPYYPQPQPYYPQPQPYYPQPQPSVNYVAQPPLQQPNVVYSSGYSGYAPAVQYVPGW